MQNTSCVIKFEMLDLCRAAQSSPADVRHTGMTREDVDTAVPSTTASPGAMQLQTPVKGVTGELFNGQQFKTPSANPSHLLHWQHIQTPTSSGYRHQRAPRVLHDDDCKTPGGKSLPSTGAVYNPFDDELLDRLQGPLCSPSVFAEGSTPGSSEKTPKTFRWTIDQIAILKPADIEEMPLQQALLGTHDDIGTETEAQKAIDEYFSNHILPSPWTDSAKKKPFRLPRTPAAESDDECDHLASQVHNKSPTRDMSCQTTLTLPTGFDIFQVLAEHYTYQGDDGAHDLSTSSLRRKLFFQGTSASPVSPVKNGYSAGVSTEMFSHDCLFRPSPSQPLPISCLFSSSPIGSPSSHVSSGLRRTGTSHVHRFLTTPDMMASPQLSPIRTSRSRTHAEHPLREFDTPNQDSPSQFWSHRTMDSPGMSPISTGCASHQKLPSVAQELQFCDADSPAPMTYGDERRSHPADITSDDAHKMDLDTSLCTQSTSSVRQTLFRDDTEISTQDAGYDTNSLTGQEMGFHSRNLTSHDAEMLSVTNHDTGFQSGSSSSSSLTSGLVVHSDLTNQFCQLPVACGDIDTTFSEPDDSVRPRRMSLSLDDDILYRARRLLGKPPDGATAEKMSSKSVILNDFGTVSEEQLRVSDVATAMLNRAKNDFAVYFDSIKDGSSTSTPIATTANSEHLQHCYGSDTCGWS